MSYYYLVASLPALVIGEPPPFSAADLMRRCANLLDERDQQQLRLALDGREPESRLPFLRGWVRADTQLRNALARVRAAKLGAEPREYLRDHGGFDVGIEKAATDAYARPNPLERELALDRFRWKWLDDEVQKEPFSFSAILAFAIKLRIVMRWAGVTDEAGRGKLQEMVEAMAKK